MLIVQLNLLVMRTMLALRLSGYGRETKRPAIGYGQRPENSQRAEVWADGWAEGEGLGMDVRGSKGFEFARGGEGAEGEGGGMGFEFVRGGEGEYGLSSLMKQNKKGKNRAVFCFDGKRIFFLHIYEVITWEKRKKSSAIQ